MTTTAKAAEIIRLLVEAGVPHDQALQAVREALEAKSKGETK